MSRDIPMTHEALCQMVLEVIERCLHRHEAAADVLVRSVERNGLRQNDETLIVVSPGDQAAGLQVHAEGPAALDVTVGESIRLEYLFREPSDRDHVLEQLEAVISAVLDGCVSERVIRRGNRVGRSRGEIVTSHGVVRSSVRDTTVGWLLRGGEEQKDYQPYPRGEVRIRRQP